jgi:hypothetical protein
MKMTVINSQTPKTKPIQASKFTHPTLLSPADKNSKMTNSSIE